MEKSPRTIDVKKDKIQEDKPMPRFIFRKYRPKRFGKNIPNQKYIVDQ